MNLSPALPMLSDDAYTSQLQSTIESLRYWIPSVADAVRVEELETEGFWKIFVNPKTPGACPFELIFRADRHYDMVIAGETYEDLKLASFDFFLPLVEAISEGRVIQRRRVSQSTGRTYDIETIVTMKDGRQWSRKQRVPGLPDQSEADGLELRDRHFLAYRR
jgi:hypothetical protein